MRQSVFRTFVLFCLIGFVGFSAHARSKYGFLAGSDEGVLEVVRESDAVVLGRIDQDVKTAMGWDLHVTVAECYKGTLKPGDSIFIAIAAESGPDPAEEIGKQRFFFLSKNAHVEPVVTNSFWCDWTNNVRFEKYGEPFRELLRSVAQREIACLDVLLAVSVDREAPMDSGEEIFPRIRPQAFGNWSHPLLAMCWVPRAELLTRQRYWKDCLAKHAIPHGQPSGKRSESFVFSDFSVAEYQQSIFIENDGPRREGTYAESIATEMWRRWIPGDKGAALFKRLVLDFPAAAQKEPEETSWCVRMKYLQDGKFRVRHFYVRSRMEIQTLLHEVREAGVDCSNWDEKDKRLSTTEWMRKDLKYDYQMWYK